MSKFGSELEQHVCCRRSESYLKPFWLDGCWRWKIDLRCGDGTRDQIAVAFCPWCGEKLPEEIKSELFSGERVWSQFRLLTPIWYHSVVIPEWDDLPYDVRRAFTEMMSILEKDADVRWQTIG